MHPSMMGLNNYQQPQQWMAPPYFGARPYEENPAPPPKLTRSSSNTSLYSRTRQPDFSTVSGVSGRRAMASSPTASVRSKCKSLPGQKDSSQGSEEEGEGSDEEKPPENSLFSWECEHCTYVNPEGTRVCSICCKTPSADFHPAPDSQYSVRRAVKPSIRRGTAKQQIATRREMRANEERRRPSEVRESRETREPDYSEIGRRSLQRRRKSKVEINGHVESSSSNNNNHRASSRHRGILTNLKSLKFGCNLLFIKFLFYKLFFCC